MALARCSRGRILAALQFMCLMWFASPFLVQALSSCCLQGLYRRMPALLAVSRK